MNKINILSIITDHISTLKNYRTGKYKKIDFMIFFILPIIIAIILAVLHPLLTEQTPNALLISLSVFTALMLNLLMLIYNLLSGIDEKDNNNDIETETDKKSLKIRFIKEIYYNIAFCILVSIITIFLLIIISLNIIGEDQIKQLVIYVDTLHKSMPFIFNVTSLESVKYIREMLTFSVYYLLFVFVFTLFMILKRVHILFSKEIKVKEELFKEIEEPK